MSLPEDEKKTLVARRLERARDTLQEAIDIITMEHWHAAANRLYYACYYAVYALLINNGITAHTHSGVSGMFGLHFVSKGIISKDNGRFFRRLFELRQSSDYDDWVYIKESDIKPLVEPAKKFIEAIEKLINENS